jgi:tRNA (uracil-5-)-methyltransferase TRM9
LATSERRQKAIEVLLLSVSPAHGRILIYVWAVDQDDASKRSVPSDAPDRTGVDAHVPWVLSKTDGADLSMSPKIYQRYYHFFAKGELSNLAMKAAASCGLLFGSSNDFRDVPQKTRGAELIYEGYEKSNFYIELRLWEK